MSPKEYSWLEYAPYKNKSVGNVKRFSWLGTLKGSKAITAYSPRKVNGKLDGLIFLMTSPSAPN